jgi:hypothetical protein
MIRTVSAIMPNDLMLSATFDPLNQTRQGGVRRTQLAQKLTRLAGNRKQGFSKDGRSPSA